MKKTKIILLILFVNFLFVMGVQAEEVIYNNYSKELVSCGSGMITDIPVIIPKVISIAYTVLQIAIPVVLVVIGSIDLMKGITAQKEDEIKKGQQIFIKRLISAALVFFVFVIVKAVISLVADGSGTKIMECAECFVSNKCTKQTDIDDSAGAPTTPGHSAPAPK